MLITSPLRLTNPANLSGWPTPRFDSFVLMHRCVEQHMDPDGVFHRAFHKVNESLKTSLNQGPAQRKGLFVAIEGPDGVGKTTLVDELRRRWPYHVKTEGVVVTCEPTRGEFGMMARSMLSEMNEDSSMLLHQALCMMFVADRLEHLEQEVYPALREGKTVITDRYALSQLVYQTTMMRLPLAEARQAEGLVQVLHQACPMPDLTVWMDAPDEVLDERIKRRGNAESVEMGETARKIRQRYRELLSEPFKTDDGMSASIVTRCADQFVVFKQHDKPEKIYHAARVRLLARLNSQRC